MDGQLVEEEVASLAHELVVSWLIRILGAWIVPRGGFVLGSETKLIISPRRGRKPDVLLFFGNSPRQPSSSSSSSALDFADIVIEVITATPRDQRRDRVEKKADYAALRVGQYWLVDPEARTLEVLALDSNGRFLEVLAAAEGIHPIPGCTDLSLDLDALWAEVDRGTAFLAAARTHETDG
ncbi:MAG: Uma2 family endonuclease [Myxococcota bacterium]